VTSSLAVVVSGSQLQARLLPAVCLPPTFPGVPCMAILQPQSCSCDTSAGGKRNRHHSKAEVAQPLMMFSMCGQRQCQNSADHKMHYTMIS
jgi:hypothetical protein